MNNLVVQNQATKITFYNKFTTRNPKNYLLSGLYPNLRASVIFFFISSTESVDFYQIGILLGFFSKSIQVAVPVLSYEGIATNLFQQKILFSYLSYQSVPPFHSNIEPLCTPVIRH